MASNYYFDKDASQSVKDDINQEWEAYEELYDLRRQLADSKERAAAFQAQLEEMESAQATPKVTQQVTPKVTRHEGEESFPYLRFGNSPGPYGSSDDNYELRNSGGFSNSAGPYGSCDENDDTAVQVENRHEKKVKVNFSSTPKVSRPSAASVDPAPARILKREVHPEKYDGKKSWDNYIIHFEACRDLNGWSEQDACSWLAACLTGNAVQALGGHGAELGYRELKRKLERSFGPCSRPENYMIEFRNRKRKPGETLQELAQSLRQLVVRAYPDMPIASQELLANEQFKDALEDGELRAAIFRQRPKTLEEALSAAIEMECFLKAEKARGRGKSSFTRVVDAHTQPTSQSFNQGHERLMEIESQMQKMMTMMQDLQSQISSGNMKKKNGKACYYCDDAGHFQYKCPKFERDDPEGYRKYLEKRNQGNGQWPTQRALGRPQRGDVRPGQQTELNRNQSNMEVPVPAPSQM